MLKGLQPNQVKKYSKSELNVLCDEIRSTIFETVTRCGGHLASNLGAVESTVALFYTFDFPKDKIVFDVGHQCYAHKLLSGRKDEFSSIRTDGGLSGFPDREESEYDPFGAGHSSTSVSAALGFARADRIAGAERYTVAVVGDGAYTGGMIHEALNNCRRDLNLIVVLNDNEMSISHSTGMFARHFSRIRIHQFLHRIEEYLLAIVQFARYHLQLKLISLNFPSLIPPIFTLIIFFTSIIL